MVNLFVDVVQAGFDGLVLRHVGVAEQIDGVGFDVVQEAVGVLHGEQPSLLHDQHVRAPVPEVLLKPVVV